MSMLRPLFVVTGSLALITGLAYPLAFTGFARVAFPAQAAGSLIVKDGKILGSRLIGQHTEDPRYFWGRLSATDFPTDAANSSGSNYAASNPAFRAAAQARIAALRAADPGNDQPVPVDLVTASGSGLDPHISPAAADYQIKRVARLRGMTEVEVKSQVIRATTGRTLGLIGEPVVNVLELNLALDAARK